MPDPNKECALCGRGLSGESAVVTLGTPGQEANGVLCLDSLGCRRTAWAQRQTLRLKVAKLEHDLVIAEGFIPPDTRPLFSKTVRGAT